MKKFVAVVLSVLMIACLAACSPSPKQESSQSIESSAPQPTEQPTPEPTQEPTPEPTPEVKTEFSIGEAAEIETWKVTLTSAEFVEKIEPDSYSYFAPDTEGNKYLVAKVTVENIGKQADTFLSSFTYGDDIATHLLFGDGYEFTSTQLLGYDQDISNDVINPLSSVSGEIVFEVPPTVEESSDPLSLIFGNNKDEISFKIR